VASWQASEIIAHACFCRKVYILGCLLDLVQTHSITVIQCICNSWQIKSTFSQNWWL